MHTSPLKEYTIKYLDIQEENPSERALKEYILKNVETAYHPVGTCKMGKDNMSVVDTNLKVHNINKLRIIDASIMP